MASGTGTLTADPLGPGHGVSLDWPSSCASLRCSVKQRFGILELWSVSSSSCVLGCIVRLRKVTAGGVVPGLLGPAEGLIAKS